MSEYGVTDEGFVVKPFSEILNEIEQDMITEFGPGVIQTSESPFGQLNALFADLTQQLWLQALDLYQSYDPAQAEGTRLDSLAKIRLLTRGAADDTTFRQQILNEDVAHVSIQDLDTAIANVDGVTYHRVVTNDSNVASDDTLDPCTVAVVVVGGDDEAIGDVMIDYIVPGMNTYGNTVITSSADGYCRQLNILRPVDVPCTVTINVKTGDDINGCPPPSAADIANTVANQWPIIRYNGLNVSLFSLRSIIERQYTNVEVVSFTGSRDGIGQFLNQDIQIDFTQIASIALADITIVVES